MPDLYLHSLMHREEKNKVIDPFQAAIDKEIEAYIEANVTDLDNKKQNNYTPSHLARLKLKEQIKNELLESIAIPELSSHIDKALHILNHLKDKSLHSIEIQNALLLLDHLNPQDFFAKTLLQNLNISSDAMQWIVNLATAKFKEENYSDALSLFLFAATLDDEQIDYYFRAAIAAQKNNNYGLAQRLYALVITNNPSFIGPRLFTVECYLQEGLYDKAIEEWSEVEKIANNAEIEVPWLDFLSSLKNLLELTTKKAA